jgi:hypothetical protein
MWRGIHRRNRKIDKFVAEKTKPGYSNVKEMVRMDFNCL